tara:strand:+ start:1457 stop:1690 length:234 start_codon:yes stop_codon:yes gene_type:complete
LVKCKSSVNYKKVLQSIFDRSKFGSPVGGGMVRESVTRLLKSEGSLEILPLERDEWSALLAGKSAQRRYYNRNFTSL